MMEQNVFQKLHAHPIKLKKPVKEKVLMVNVHLLQLTHHLQI